MASFPYGPVAPATGLTDAFTERAAEPATAHGSQPPKHRAEGASADWPLFIETHPTDPICTVTDRRQVDPDDAPNGESARSYQELFAPLAISTTAGQVCGQAVYLCSAALGANARFCR